MAETMQNTHTPDPKASGWTTEDEKRWYADVVAKSDLNETTIDTRMPFTSPEIQANIFNAVKASFWRHSENIRITNHFYLALGHLIEAYGEWKNAPEELKVDKLEDLETESIVLRQQMISNNLDVVKAIWSVETNEDAAAKILGSFLDTFLRELRVNVIDPILQKTLK